MMDFILAPTIIGIITYGIYKLFELFVCRRERLAIIEKMNDSLSVQQLNKSLSPNYLHPRFSFGALKAGCLLVGIGLGLLIGFIISANCVPDYFNNANQWEYRNILGAVYGSCVLLFGGIALIVAFIVELKISKKRS